MESIPPTPATHPPGTPSGDRVLVLSAGVVALVLFASLYLPRFAASPVTFVPGETIYRVDLNKAGKSELMQIPGIGPTRADAILAHRHTTGEFRDVDQIGEVKGIGPKTREQIRPFVLVPGTDSDGRPSTAIRPNEQAPTVKLPKIQPGEPPIDVNKASEAELQRLPGIGPTLAARIVAARPYSSVDDLRRAKGIGAKILETIRPHVTVSLP